MHQHDDCESESIIPVYRPGRTWVEASRRHPRPPIRRARRFRRGCILGGWLITFIFWLLPEYRLRSLLRRCAALVLQRHVRQLSMAQVIIFQELKSFLRISIRTWLMDQKSL